VHRPGGSPKAKYKSDFYPLTFNQSRIRTYRTPSQSYERDRIVPPLIGLNPDPNTVGECLLRGIKEGV
jgi:hypothetical protein